MLNIDPTKPDRTGSYDLNDPAIKYISPQGIGAVPEIYLNNLLMLVLECNCEPSPYGAYKCARIHKNWIGWLRKHLAFDSVAHIEESPNEITGEVEHYLWRRRDWIDTAPAREASKAASAKAHHEWWTNRFRAHRSVLHLHEAGDMSLKSAQSMVQDWCANYFSPNLPEEAKTLFETLLSTVKFFEPISSGELEDFMSEWKGRSGHLYSSEFDILQEEED